MSSINGMVLVINMNLSIAKCEAIKNDFGQMYNIENLEIV